MTHRQQKVPPALRIVAAGGIVLWLLASSFCSVEHLFADDHHHAKADASGTLAHHESDHSQAAEAAEHAHGEANHPHDSEQPSHDSHPCEGGSDHSCCTALMAPAQITKPFNPAEPFLESLNFLCPALQARDPMLAAPEAKSLRQAKGADLVLTPVVCLGPAHRSLAPPSPA